MSQEKTAIVPTRSADYPEWYQQVIKAADLAESSPVRGCMVIKPWGYALWENVQRELDRRFKSTGHRNAYFPLFIPMSYLQREAEHVKGFAKECAVVTHHRLEPDPEGGLMPAGPLEEPLVVRPTSETIIYSMYAKWVQSYRDLPLLLNQWANVVRGELRPRLFLRTAEFLWQEGHTAHATADEAEEETQLILRIYREVMESELAMPPVTGLKSDSEKFAGAVRSYACEALMQDNRALQAGTSHFLGQNFSRQFDLKFQSEQGREEYAWNTSWGVSTRLVGGMVMTHGDDEGIVVPPRLAPTQVVIVPIVKSSDAKASAIQHKADELCGMLTDQHLRVKVDRREHLSPGARFYEWERKGVPFRIELGPKDLDKEQVVLARRVLAENGTRKEFLPQAHAVAMLPERIDALQREQSDINTRLKTTVIDIQTRIAQRRSQYQQLQQQVELAKQNASISSQALDELDALYRQHQIDTKMYIERLIEQPLQKAGDRALVLAVGRQKFVQRIARHIAEAIIGQLAARSAEDFEVRCDQFIRMQRVERDELVELLLAAPWSSPSTSGTSRTTSRRSCATSRKPSSGCCRSCVARRWSPFRPRPGAGSTGCRRRSSRPGRCGTAVSRPASSTAGSRAWCRATHRPPRRAAASSCAT